MRNAAPEVKAIICIVAMGIAALLIHAAADKVFPNTPCKQETNDAR